MKAHFVVYVNPSGARINRRMALSRGRLIHSSAYRKAKDDIAAAITVPEGWDPTYRCRVLVRAYWTKRALAVDPHPYDESLPNADSDAPIKCILDAAKKAGVYTDDALVCTSVGEGAWDKDRPRIEIWVWQVDPADPRASLVELVETIAS